MAIAVSDAAAMAIAVAIKEQTLFLQVAFGSQAGITPGTIAWTINSLNKQDVEIIKSLNAIEKQLRSINVAMGTLSSEMEKNRTGLANMQVTMSRSLAVQQLSVANEIKATKFQEKTVNTALAEAGKPPIEVTPTNYTDTVKSAVEDISIVNAQTLAAATVGNIVSNAITEGVKISTQWAAQTAVGKFVTDYVTELKLKTQLLFAEDEAKAEIREALSRLYANRNGE
jgi:hypothetical protein